MEIRVYGDFSGSPQIQTNSTSQESSQIKILDERQDFSNLESLVRSTNPKDLVIYLIPMHAEKGLLSKDAQIS